MIDFLLVCSVQFLVLILSVVSYTEHHRTRVVVDLGFEQGSDGRTIIDNYCHILETIDGNRGIPFVVGETKQHLLNNLVWEGNIPPNSKGSRISATSKNGTVSKQRGSRSLWDDEGRGHFKWYSRVFCQSLADKVDLGLHGLVD
jgi:hypothetical protein